MYQPWSTMQMPHVAPAHYYPYYSQPTSFPVLPVVPPMSPFTTPPVSPFVPPMPHSLLQSRQACLSSLKRKMGRTILQK